MINKLFFSTLLLLAFICERQSVIAQVIPIDINSQAIEAAAETNDQVSDLSELEDNFIFYKENPIDLNTATKDELLQFELFNDLQVDALTQHIINYGKLIRLEELQSINGFDLEFIIRILPYIKISGPLFDLRLKPKTLLEQGKQQLTLRWQRVLEAQSGYSTNENLSSSYLGDPYQLKVKYRFLAGRYFSAGLTAEKDAGEQFFKGAQKNGFDFYSFHLFIRPGKFVKVIALGDYQVQFAQGLVAWSGLAFGKSSEVIAIKKQGSGIKPFTSSNEFSFLRGAACSFEIGNISLDTWLSYRNLDANIENQDSLIGDLEVTSIGASGFHRNTNEIADRKVLSQKIVGTHLMWRKGSVKFEITNELSQLSGSLKNGNDPYQIYNFNGSNNASHSLAYSWQVKNFNFFGETAMDMNGNLATVNGFLGSLDPKISISVLHRSYAVNYSSINANPFKEGTKAQNENGIYSGLQLLVSKAIKFAFYIDQFKFPWLRYQVDAPTNGYEYLSQVTYTPVRSTELYFRVKYQNKATDEIFHENSIDHQIENTKTNIRFNARFKFGTSFSFLNRIEWVKVKSNEINNGVLLLQEIHYQPMGKPISIIFSYQLFNTQNYDARIYAYEQDLPGSSSIPASYYAGSRYYGMIRYHVNRSMDLWIRYGRTIYDNRKTIGSSGEAIQGNHKSDLKLQLRFNF